MRISDWSSDVCSSDLVVGKTLAEFDNRERVIWHDWAVQLGGKGVLQERAPPLFIEEAGEKIRPCGIDRANLLVVIDELLRHGIIPSISARRHNARWSALDVFRKIGRASCREEVC